MGIFFRGCLKFQPLDLSGYMYPHQSETTEVSSDPQDLHPFLK